jgi:hypothetical protein
VPALHPSRVENLIVIDICFLLLLRVVEEVVVVGV